MNEYIRKPKKLSKVIQSLESSSASKGFLDNRDRAVSQGKMKNIIQSNDGFVQLKKDLSKTDPEYSSKIRAYNMQIYKLQRGLIRNVINFEDLIRDIGTQRWNQYITTKRNFMITTAQAASIYDHGGHAHDQSYTAQDRFISRLAGNYYFTGDCNKASDPMHKHETPDAWQEWEANQQTLFLNQERDRIEEENQPITEQIGQITQLKSHTI